MRWTSPAAVAVLLVFCSGLLAPAQQQAQPRERFGVPPQVVRARRFLAQRAGPATVAASVRAAASPRPLTGSPSTASRQPLGPSAVSTANYGLVTGRISSIAFDPADPTGNRVYLGTTGGGVWLSQNTATSNTANVQFVPLTDAPGAISAVYNASISIGAVTVQPGGTGVVLAGTGDPNDALDSYYGGGILRSTDGGATWSLIQATSDERWAFLGEGFAGFAWSTVNPRLVVAAVSQAFDAVLTNATHANATYEGLYYSTDGGATWALARISDASDQDVQGPWNAFAEPEGNAATSVVWNPVRRLFLAAVRYHGFYQSSDGITWTRLATQPGTGLTMAHCPTNQGETGSVACPIFRGSLAVNPLTGDTFAWAVDAYNQDQGLWQDVCAMQEGSCANPGLAFGKQWNTSALEANDPAHGPRTIENGDYTLALAAVPSGQDTLLLAGGNDLWKCSLAAACAWRNTTNDATCKSAQVAPFQHALAWNAANPQEILIGNDGGLWRSLDAVGETDPACSASDATHFQNLNGALGSLAEVGSLAQVGASPAGILVGLGVNGTAGLKSAAGPDTEWPQALDGDGGPVAIDTANPANWYVNNQPGVSIHRCTQSAPCTPADFGSAPAVTNADVGGDGNAMGSPAPFLIDPLDPSQLLVGTCRVWRGPANGSGWSSANAISPFLDGEQTTGACNGDPLIRTITAMALGNGNEVIYAGMWGAFDGGGALAGHVFRAIYNPAASSSPVWQDLTANPVANNVDPMNLGRFDISSIFVDPHDASGSTVYVTVQGMPEVGLNARTVYRSTDGGAHWQSMISNLPPAPAIAVDPQDANTVYIGLDTGVYSTRQIANCLTGPGNCWSSYGNGLPESPVTQLSVAGSTLIAGTYGRGVWQIPLWTSGAQLAAADVQPLSLTFAAQSADSTSSAQTVTVTNTGGLALTISSVATSGDFGETDNCQNTVVEPGASCAIQVVFVPAQAGSRGGELTIGGNIAGGQIVVSLTGTGVSPAGVFAAPPALDFGSVAVGTKSAALQVTIENPTPTAVPVTSLAATGPFVVSTDSCGTSLAPNSDCQITLAFAPVKAGPATGTLSVVDASGTQAVVLTGNGAAPTTDSLSASALTFPGTALGLISAAQIVSMTNGGGLPLTSIVATTSGPFQVAGNCLSQLAANSSCTYSVVYAPTATGVQTGVLTIADALRTQTVTLSGTGLPPPQIGVTPAALDFEPQPIGTAGAPHALTITNNGGAPLANIGFQIAGISSSSFSTGTTTCSAPLNSGGSCTTQVVFTPVAAGGVAAQLTVASSTLGATAVQVPLTGTGQAPAGVNVSPPQMTFVVGTLGQPSPAQTATITNSGALPADGLILAATPPFSLSQNTCAAALAPGASCTASVLFTPAANGAAMSALQITSSSNPAVVILNGIGGAAGFVRAQPAVLVFPTTGAGATSHPQTVALTNSGPLDLTGLTFQISSGFQLVSTTCTSTLAIGASCTASVVFAPGTAGPQTGTLTIAGGALPVPEQVALSGMGFDFAAAVSGSASQTISNGQTASFTLAITPGGGSSGTFTFACGSLPASLACAFNPASEAVAANGTGNVMVQLVTGHSARLAEPPRGHGWGAAGLLCGLILLPAALVRRRRIFWLAALLAILVGGVSSCVGSGGGSGATPLVGQGSSDASVGTFAIPVTVSANGIAHSVTLSLTVD
jgi:hypothetical protein